jgi:hypothetical protein
MNSFFDSLHGRMYLYLLLVGIVLIAADMKVSLQENELTAPFARLSSYSNSENSVT